MPFVLAALAVFWVIKVLRQWIDAPSWLWVLVQNPLSAAALIPWMDGNLKWVVASASVSGIVTLVQHTENLFIAKADEAIASVMRRR